VAARAAVQSCLDRRHLVAALVRLTNLQARKAACSEEVIARGEKCNEFANGREPTAAAITAGNSSGTGEHVRGQCRLDLAADGIEAHTVLQVVADGRSRR